MFAIDKRQLLKQETKVTVHVFAMCVFLLEYLFLSMALAVHGRMLIFPSTYEVLQSRVHMCVGK